MSIKARQDEIANLGRITFLGIVYVEASTHHSPKKKKKKLEFSNRNQKIKDNGECEYKCNTFI